MLRKRLLSGLLTISLVVTLLGLNGTVLANGIGQNTNIKSNWSNPNGTITQDFSGISFSGSGTGMLLESYYQNAFSTVDGFNVDLNLLTLEADTGSNFGIYLTSSTSASSNGMKLVFQPFASNSSIYASYIWPFCNGAYSAANSDYLEISKATGVISIRFAKVSGIWNLFIDNVDKGVDLSSISSVLDGGNLYFGLYAWADTQNSYSLKVNKMNGYSTGLPDVASTSKWENTSGTIAQGFNGIAFSGSGTGMLAESFLQDAFTDVNGFSTTINLDALGSASNMNFGIYLNQGTSSGQNGLKIVFVPFGANADINACWVNPYYNAGAGLQYATPNNNYLEIDKVNGALNVAISKDGNGDWHLFINGTDRGVDLSSIKPILDAGNLYFGLYAWADAQNNCSLRVDQVNGYATGKATNVSEYRLIKSNKGNVSANQAVNALSSGVNLNGSLTSAGLNFKYGYNKSFTNLNGFNTTMNISLDGANGVNGSPNFNFGLMTTGSGINADRLDAFDYLGSQVLGARGLQMRFNKYETYYSIGIFVLGENGYFGDDSDFINGNNIDIPASGNLNISFVTVSNGSSHWSILANGREIIGNNPTVNAELDALSQMGACPVFSAGYDSLGSLTSANARMVIGSIGSMNLKQTVNFGTYCKAGYTIYNIAPETLVSSFKNQIISVNAAGIFADISNQSLADTSKIGTGATFKIIEDGSETNYTALIFGDVTGDGDISVNDLIKIKAHILKLTTLSKDTNQYWAADVVRTGSITISDLLAVKKQILKLVDIYQGV